MVVLISTCKFDAKTTPDAFQHVPDLFEGPRDRKKGLGDAGPEHKVKGHGAGPYGLGSRTRKWGFSDLTPNSCEASLKFRRRM